MASITQTIPQYSLGMSEQPDQLKFPGQVTEVTNAIPDLTKGLFKRPDAKRIGTDALASVQSGGSWFHYFRDESEGSYIGQVAADGQVRVWSCKTGALQTTVYGTGGQTAIQNYLATSTPENLQFLTINDTTFVTNRDTTNANTLVGTTGTTDSAPHAHYGFIELLRTENGRQYGVNINNGTDVTTITRATKIKITGHSFDEGDGSGHCPGIGTEVYAATAKSSYGATENIESIRNSTAYSAVTIPTSDVFVGNSHLISSALASLNNTGVLLDGDPIVYTSTTGTAIVGLTVGTTYYYFRGVDSRFYLATSKSNALAGTKISITGPGAGNHVFTPVGTQRVVSGKTNLTFRVTALGQQGVSPNYAAANNGPDGDNYRCSYNIEAVLLHGGEGWAVGDVVRVTPEHADEADSSDSQAYVDVTVTEIESTEVNATVNSNNNGDGLIRPAPTPFDADTAVTSDTIIGGIIAGLPSGISGKHIGTGIYLFSSNPFSVEVVEEDLMRCFQKSVNDVQNLPNQCKHGYIVKIANSRMSDEDDYYLRFDGTNNRDGVGSWIECAQGGIAKTLTNMPLVIQRTAFNTSTQIATFTVRQFTYQDRRVGDDTTNPMPSFVVARINKVLFFRNRLALLSGENVITSRPGTLDENSGGPDFFVETALTVSASDPVDISAASMFPSELFDGIEMNTGLVVFSTNQQFLLAADDTVFNPDTAKLRSISTFNYNETIPPISLGTTLAYVDNSGKFSRFNEMANIQREGEPNVVEVSKVVPTLLPKDIDLLTNSRENSIILLGKTGSDDVFGYKYFQVSDQRQQAAWFKWKFNNPLIYHFIINDEYFFLDSDYYLQSIKLVQAETDPSIEQDNVDFLLHLDNHTTISGGSFDAATNVTTFNNVVNVASVTTPNHPLAMIDTNTNLARVGRYGKPTNNTVKKTTVPTSAISGNDITITNHGFTAGERIDYHSNGGTALSTTVNNNIYFVKVVDANTIRLSSTAGNAIASNGAYLVINNPGNNNQFFISGTLTITGQWTDSYILGYLYPYEVKFPTFYPTRREGNNSRADINSSLVLHRIKFHFGKIGLYETTLERVGKRDYTEVYESTELDEYEASDAPYLEEFIKTVPVYEKNTNVDVTLRSSHPAPATLRAVSWEGDYSPKYYRRV